MRAVRGATSGEAARLGKEGVHERGSRLRTSRSGCGTYEFGELDELTHAYVVTVHR